jgi:ATP synthase protein I
MTKLVNAQVDALGDSKFESDAPALTPQEAILLRPKIAVISLWGVVGLQALVGVVLVVVLLVSGQMRWAVSAGYGVLAVILPALVFARGVTRARQASGASQALARVFLWEAGKIVLTLVMLLLAPKLVLNLNWLALLAGFEVTMKASWLAMFWLHKRKASLAV